MENKIKGKTVKVIHLLILDLQFLRNKLNVKT